MKTLVRNFGVIVVSMVVLWGCSKSRQMMPTPNVYLTEESQHFQDLNPELQSSEVRLFYITDRAPEQDEKGNLRYGYGRSSSVAFGTVIVDLGEDLTWEDLLLASRLQKRLKPVELKVRQVTEVLRGPDTPVPFAMVDGKIVEQPEESAEREAATQAFRQILIDQLAMTPRKEVFLYVHGYHNSFEDAAFAMGELWHFLGRIGVPFIYTWPAGYPGLFGYTYDRESSEFTVYHLRRALNFLAGLPEVEKINVIAHSRGTDVAVNALRELTIAARAAGIDPREKLKINNFIIAAPDIDLAVAEQRIAGDQLPLAVKRFTIYTSPEDKAIGFARKLFQSPQGRVGNFGPENVSERMKQAMEFGKGNLAIVQFLGASDSFLDIGDSYGHSYFRNAPTVSSDVVLMLRDDLDPGTPARPLEYVGLNFWRIPPGYPGGVQKRLETDSK